MRLFLGAMIVMVVAGQAVGDEYARHYHAMSFVVCNGAGSQRVPPARSRRIKIIESRRVPRSGLYSRFASRRNVFVKRLVQ